MVVTLYEVVYEEVSEALKELVGLWALKPDKYMVDYSSSPMDYRSDTWEDTHTEELHRDSRGVDEQAFAALTELAVHRASDTAGSSYTASYLAGLDHSSHIGKLGSLALLLQELSEELCFVASFPHRSSPSQQAS